MKSCGNLSSFLLTAWTRALASTPYNAAKCSSSRTFSPRMNRIVWVMRSTMPAGWIHPAMDRPMYGVP
jgi:hypothetical protein